MQTICKLKVDKICKGSIRYSGKVDKEGTDVPLTMKFQSALRPKMFRVGFYNEQDRLVGLSKLCWTERDAALEYQRLNRAFKRIAIIPNEGPLVKRAVKENDR